MNALKFTTVVATHEKPIRCPGCKAYQVVWGTLAITDEIVLIAFIVLLAAACLVTAIRESYFVLQFVGAATAILLTVGLGAYVAGLDSK